MNLSPPNMISPWKKKAAQFPSQKAHSLIISGVIFMQLFLFKTHIIIPEIYLKNRMNSSSDFLWKAEVLTLHFFIFSSFVIYITKLFLFSKLFTFLFWFLTLLSMNIHIMCPYPEMALITNTVLFRKRTFSSAKSYSVQHEHLCSSSYRWKDSSLVPQ